MKRRRFEVRHHHHPFRNSPKVDSSAVIGTVASLAAFVVMGWLVHSLMWHPLQRGDLESVGPEAPAVPEAPATNPGANPGEPRRTNSNMKFTA